jgi:hypothetical protein
LYYCDPHIAPAGTKQPRNIHGSKLASNRGYGVSLGGWASTAVCEQDEVYSRPSMILLTVEFRATNARKIILLLLKSKLRAQCNAVC